MRAIILAAGVGKRLRGITENPKCLLRVGGVALLERYLKALDRLNILDVVLVVGCKKEMIIEFIKDLKLQGNIRFVENPDFNKGSILSLYKAIDELDENILLMDADVYFETEILNRLVKAKPANLVAIDTASSSSGEEVMAGIRSGRILDMKRNLAGNYDMVGEVAGFYKFNRLACQELKKTLEKQIKLGKYDLGYEDILPLLFQKVRFEPIMIDRLKWIEIDTEEDIHRAETLAKG